MAKATRINQGNQEQQGAASKDPFQRRRSAAVLKQPAKGEHDRYANQKNKQWKNQIIEMKPFPLGVLELSRKEPGRSGLAHPVERIHQRICTQNPEHIKTSQRIHRHKAFGWSWTFGVLRCVRHRLIDTHKLTDERQSKMLPAVQRGHTVTGQKQGFVAPFGYNT